jgi:hypothetical protein
MRENLMSISSRTIGSRFWGLLRSYTIRPIEVRFYGEENRDIRINPIAQTPNDPRDLLASLFGRKFT